MPLQLELRPCLYRAWGIASSTTRLTSCVAFAMTLSAIASAYAFMLSALRTRMFACVFVVSMIFRVSKGIRFW